MFSHRGHAASAATRLVGAVGEFIREVVTGNPPSGNESRPGGKRSFGDE
jgi:hypothetical protein